MAQCRILARDSLRSGWRPRRGLRAASPLDRRARPCVGSSRSGTDVGQLARGSAFQRVSRTDETAAGLVTGPKDCKRTAPAPSLPTAMEDRATLCLVPELSSDRRAL